MDFQQNTAECRLINTKTAFPNCLQDKQYQLSNLEIVCFVLQDDRYFLSGSLDGKIRLWNIPDKKVALWNELEGTGKCV